MASVELNRDWALGTLRVAPGILPSWIARTGPIYVPVPRSAIRPHRSFQALAHVETPIGGLPLVGGDGSPLYDLERLERLLLSERAFTFRPRAFPTGVPPVVRRKVARAEHQIRGFFASSSRLTFSVGADAIGSLWAFTRDQYPVHVWPEGRSAAFVVTHDVEEPRSQRALALARAEAALGIRATYFLVPSQWGNTDLPELLRSLGHEVACHGLDHSGHEVVASPQDLAEAAASLALREPAGYRAPRFACGPAHADKVGSAFQYDSSRPETRQAPRRLSWIGCGSVFPFVEGERLVQLPVSLPTELDLIDDGLTWQQVRIAWRAKWRLVKDGSGLGVLCTHVPAPGGPEEVLPFLRELLADEEVWIGPAGELVAFLLARAAEPGVARPWKEAQARPREANRSIRRVRRSLPVLTGPGLRPGE